MLGVLGSEGCFCQTAYAKSVECTTDQYCLDGVCTNDQVLGDASVLTVSNALRIGASTNLGGEILSSLTVFGALNLTVANLTVSASGQIVGEGKGNAEQSGPGYFIDQVNNDYKASELIGNLTANTVNVTA